MILKQAFNNNVVLAVDHNGQEVVVIGKGIGFKRKKNEEIDQQLVDKIYTLDSSSNSHPILNILNEIPPEIIYLTTKIISLGEKILDKKFNDAFLITLSDHLNFAIKRAENQLFIKNPLHWEVKSLYKKEFQVGERAVQMILEQTGQEMPATEATAIALHFVNAQSGIEGMPETIKITEITNKILDIISYHFQVNLEEDSLNFSRFLTHLRYFILRHLEKKLIRTNSASSIFTLVTQQNPQIYQCVLKIAKYLRLEYGWNISDDEMTYLILHIQRMTSRITNKTDE
ncbi:PRD domain-containing protein [Lederbergia sp. NSJ-179]|uniref:BglG family transcription antiterminator LicT n=1 Tax=Lederbergia sp. NSJ-179 TaxID=2931402 RepID=UPI001FD11E06|nr:PRD domain-containing protein [Lederbergia sp. NSJ-179]MCJ7841646.1 PRD domain-containing protein [Lederbergia sp. NSJ-179]